MIDAADAGAGTPPVPDFHSSTSPSAPCERDVSEEDLKAYGLTLGVQLDTHPDLFWVITEAFNAPLPSGWSEHSDAEARIYFYNEASGESAWEHPTDSVYKEILSLIMQLRNESSSSSRESRKGAIHDHLRPVHQRALTALEGWSGPYGSPAEGGEYFFNADSNVSSWENPLEIWQAELTVRHHVLCRCLLPEDSTGLTSGLDGGEPGDITFSGGQLDMLTSLRLPLNLIKRDSGGQDDLAPKSPISSRSFHTARSTGTISARSARTSARATGSGKTHRQASPAMRSAREDGNDSADGEYEFTFSTTQGAQMPQIPK